MALYALSVVPHHQGVTECGATQQCNVCRCARPQNVVPHHWAQGHYWVHSRCYHTPLQNATQCNVCDIISTVCSPCGATSTVPCGHHTEMHVWLPHQLIIQLSQSCLAWSGDDFLIPRIFPRSIISDNNTISPVIFINSSFLSDNYWLLCISLSELSSLYHLDIITCAKLSFKPFSNLYWSLVLCAS